MNKRSLLAHVLPFGVFMAFIFLGPKVTDIFQNSGWLLLTNPGYIIYPLQTLICAGLVIYYWKEYEFGPLKPWFWGVLSGIVVLAVWISPQALFGMEPRVDGFNPEGLEEGSTVYWLVVAARFVRLSLVVPFVEEIFWRAFLMRYLINENFTKVPFGTYRHLAFFAVAVLFALEHLPPDWIPALFTGLLWNGLAVRTKSLATCILAHAVTNFGLGLYIMATKQWGFW